MMRQVISSRTQGVLMLLCKILKLISNALSTELAYIYGLQHYRSRLYISCYIKTINWMKPQQNQISPINQVHEKVSGDSTTCPLPRLNIPTTKNYKYPEGQSQIFVHTFQQEVTFRKIQPAKVQASNQSSLEHRQDHKHINSCVDNHQEMSEQKAKCQLLYESESLRRKQTDEAIEMVAAQARDYHLSEDISAFTLRQINYLKALSVVRSQLKHEQDRKRATKSNSSDHLQQNLIKRYRTNTVLDRLLGENPSKIKGTHQQITIFSPYPRSLNIRAQTLELCKKALLKTKSIDLEVLDSNKSAGSLMPSQFKPNLQFSRRRRPRKSKEIECLHEVQYNKLMRQIENLQGINQILVTKSKTQPEGTCKEKIIHNSQQDLKDHSNKRIKYVSRKLKTTLQQHQSTQQIKFKVVNCCHSKNNGSQDLGRQSHDSSRGISNNKHKKRCNSTIVQDKQSNKNLKRFKVFNIYKNIKQDKAKENSQQEKVLEPVTNSISYPLKQRQRSQAEVEIPQLSKQITAEPNIKINLSKNNTNNIINSIKLYSETRKSKNISSLLMQERNRFKMNHLLKEMQSSKGQELFQ